MLKPLAARVAVAMCCTTLALSARPGEARDNGIVRGRVTAGSAPATGTRPAIGDLGAGLREVAGRRPAVVYLESGPRQAFDELETGHVRMDQRNEEFVPHVLAITVGTRVDFPNNDTTFHNVFSLSPIKTFDLGRYGAGHSKSVVFDKPGIVPISCDIHAHMSAYVLVFSHPFFAVTDDEGLYEIKSVPVGVYTIVAWTEAAPTESRRITVTAGSVTDTDFRIGRGR